tara:strand:- start:1533 stop:1916 length:384 start_codon:yes stop_codon:yes gene_type:complete
MSSNKFSIEYPINTSVKVLFQRLSTVSGLSEWFADNVNIQNNILTFYWENSSDQATIIKKVKDKLIRFQWIDDHGTDNYFEFQILVDEITKDIALIIIDFAEDEDEKEESILLWNSQINNLKKLIGG